MKPQKVRRHRHYVDLVQLIRSRTRLQPYDYSRTMSLSQITSFNSGNNDVPNSCNAIRRSHLALRNHRNSRENMIRPCGRPRCSQNYHESPRVSTAQIKHTDQSTSTSEVSISAQTQHELFAKQHFPKSEKSVSDIPKLSPIMIDDKESATQETNTDIIAIENSNTFCGSQGGEITIKTTSTYSDAILIMSQAADRGEAPTSSSNSKPVNLNSESYLETIHNEQVESIDDDSIEPPVVNNADDAIEENQPELIEPQLEEAAIEQTSAEELVTDEEAGGDGHHHIQIGEIEITLRSSNETNSDIPDDDDDDDEDEYVLDDSE